MTNPQYRRYRAENSRHLPTEAYNKAHRRHIAQFRVRKLGGRHYPFMYNPMWRHYGVDRDRAAGTYFNRLSKPICYDWFILDQVIVKPVLLDKFADDDILILESDGAVDLVSPGDRRPKSTFSDHLPLLARFEI